MTFTKKRKGTFGIGDIVHVIGNPTPLKVVDFGVKEGKPGTLKLKYLNSNRIKQERVHYSVLRFYHKDQ